MAFRVPLMFKVPSVKVPPADSSNSFVILAVKVIYSNRVIRLGIVISLSATDSGVIPVEPRVYRC